MALIVCDALQVERRTDSADGQEYYVTTSKEPLWKSGGIQPIMKTKTADENGDKQEGDMNDACDGNEEASHKMMVGN